MARLLVTGMSGTGKSTILEELSRRGLRTVDTDYDGWELPDRTWDEPRMAQLEREEVRRYVQTVEPVLRGAATMELDGQRNVTELADVIQRLVVCR